MSPVCSKCHRFKKKSVWRRHQKNCIPSKADLEHYTKTKSGRHAKDCDCKKCKKKRARRTKQVV